MFDVCHNRRGSHFYEHYKHSPLQSVGACVCNAYPHRMIVFPIDGKTTACCATEKKKRKYDDFGGFTVLFECFAFCKTHFESTTVCEHIKKPLMRANNSTIYKMSPLYLSLTYTQRRNNIILNDCTPKFTLICLHFSFNHKHWVILMLSIGLWQD